MGANYQRSIQALNQIFNEYRKGISSLNNIIIIWEPLQILSGSIDFVNHILNQDELRPLDMNESIKSNAIKLRDLLKNWREYNRGLVGKVDRKAEVTFMPLSHFTIRTSRQSEHAVSKSPTANYYYLKSKAGPKEILVDEPAIPNVRRQARAMSPHDDGHPRRFYVNTAKGPHEIPFDPTVTKTGPVIESTNEQQDSSWVSLSGWSSKLGITQKQSEPVRIDSNKEEVVFLETDADVDPNNSVRNAE